MNLNIKWQKRKWRDCLARGAEVSSRLLGVDASYLVSNSWWVNLEKGARISVELGIVVLLARLVSKSVLGQYQLLLSGLTVASVLSLMGLNGPLLRALARGYDGTIKRIDRVSWYWSSVGAGIIWLMGGVLWWHGQASMGRALVITGLFFPFYNVFKRWDIVLQAKEKYRERAINYLWLAGTLLVVIYGVVRWGSSDVEGIFLTYLAVHTWYGWLFYARSRRYLINEKVETGWRESGRKLYMADLFNVSYSHADKLILAAVLGTEAVAVYSVASKVGEAVKLIMGNIVSIYIPRMYKAGSRVVLTIMRERRGRLLVGMTVVLVGLWVSAPWLVEVLFSDKYVDSVIYLRWYNFVIPFHFVASIWGQLLIREKKEWVFTGATVAAGVINLLLYVTLIPAVGIMGAVIASVAYYVALAMFYGWGLRRFWFNEIK